MIFFNRIFTGLLAVVALSLSPGAFAAGGLDANVGYMLNTLFLLVCAVLVMFMAAGFAMLEAGMVRSKSVAVILAKNVTLYAVASIMFLLVGYELMYGASDSSLFGRLAMWFPGNASDIDVASGQPAAATWFFQMVFVATAASVVSGALAERVRFWAFALFTVLLTGVLYPLVGHWTWGGGWLASIGFSDFAGSTIVHSVGGWAAFAGIMLLGPRRGRFDKDAQAQGFAPSSLPMVTLGTFILWLGWFGFNGGSQLAFSSLADAHAVATIFVNTNAAAAGGVLAALAVTQMISRRINLPLLLNGALAGLVSITAEPLAPSMLEAAAIGAVGGIVMIGASRFLETFRLDDVVGAVPVHLVAGIWGTLAVPLTNPDASLLIQGIGVGSVGLFVFAVSFVAWWILKRSVGIRLNVRHEAQGGDLAETGMRAYNL